MNQHQGELFHEKLPDPINLLPKDGIVHYCGRALPEGQADHYLAELLQTVPWQHDRVFLHGKYISTRRRIAWYGDEDFSYNYSGHTRTALPWTEILSTLKSQVENHCGEIFNSCLLNLYHDGSEGMAWHSDDEPELKPAGIIASLSLGATRKFALRHKISKEVISVMLESGSLLIMQGKTQQHWQHCLRTTTTVNEPRVNLTFRQFYGSVKNY